MTLLPTTDGESYTVRGSVRNDSDTPLTEAVILARGTTYVLTRTLEPGEVYTFEFPLHTDRYPAPSALEHATPGSTLQRSNFRGGYYALSTPDETIRNIMGEADYSRSLQAGFLFEEGTEQEQNLRRRRLFLNAVIADNYFSTGRGDKVYLLGWSQQPPLSLELDGANFSVDNLTLHIIMLDTNITPPQSPMLVTPDQFTWVTEQRSDAASNAGPFDILLYQEDEIIFRFTPLASARLAEVDELMITVDPGQSGRSINRLQVWNWARGGWSEVLLTGGNGTEALIANPAGLIGPNNAVRVRIAQEVSGGLPQIANIRIAQRGRF